MIEAGLWLLIWWACIYAAYRADISAQESIRKGQDEAWK